MEGLTATAVLASSFRLLEPESNVDPLAAAGVLALHGNCVGSRYKQGPLLGVESNFFGARSITLPGEQASSVDKDCGVFIVEEPQGQLIAGVQ